MSAEGVEPAYDGVISIERIATPAGPSEAGVPTVHFVHYPGSQQIVLWLPRSWQEGYEEVAVSRDGVEVERDNVRSRINGSTQMLWASIGWPPGDYLIAITHKDGWKHEVALRKYAADAPPPEPPKPPPEPPRTGPIVYRDGFGRVIPDVDLQMRAQAARELRKRFGRHLEYEGNFRAGKIIYDDGERRIPFYHEMCGGDLHFSIDVPTVERWEAATGTPVSERDEILAFIAKRVQAEQASSWQYRFTDRSIDFY